MEAVTMKKRLSLLANELCLAEAEFNGAASILEELPNVPLLAEQHALAEGRYYAALARFQEAAPTFGAYA